MQQRRRAWMQGVTVAVTAAALIGVLVARFRAPYDADTLAIAVSQMRSYASEGTMLARETASDQLAPGFAREHARQLAGHVADTASKLRGRAAEPALDSRRARACVLAEAVLGQVRALEASVVGPARGATQAAPLDALARQFDALHHDLKPGE